MKRFVVAAVAALALAGAVTEADAQSRYRRGGTTVIQQDNGLDANTLALLAATGGLGGAGGLSAVLPLLALQGQGSTTVIEERGRRRWRGPRPSPAPTSRSR